LFQFKVTKLIPTN